MVKSAVIRILLAVAVVSGGLAQAAEDETPEQPAAAEESVPAPPPVVQATIDITGKLPTSPAVTVIRKDELGQLSPKDGGELLRIVPGVSSGRMGGHGLDPRIRGLGESGIRVLLEGAEIHGGCPNRMDPPSSFAAADSFDRVTVVRGVQTLRYGTAVGTVLFEKDPVRFVDDSWWRVDVNAGGGTFFDGPSMGLNAAVGTPGVTFEVSGDRLKMDNYSDGEGNVVRSSYDSRNGLLAVGWTPDDSTSLRLSYELNRTRDALFAGAGMDSPYSDNDAVRFRFRRAAGEGAVGEMAADIYWSRVDHLMDNYSLREWTAPMAMRAPSTSDSVGGRFWTELAASDALLITAGLDIARTNRQALRYAGPNPEMVEMLQSVLWPDADIDVGGLLLEGAILVSDASSLRFGLRVDRHQAAATAADVKPVGMNPSPRSLWNMYYEAVDDRWDETSLGGFARYEHRLVEPGMGFFVGLSRTARAADATQRYMAANSGNPGLRWVGNPNVEMAVHNLLDAGWSWSGTHHALDVALFYDRVDDEILRDRAHGQPGILQNDNATIYRNVEALRTGFEITGQWRLGSGVILGGDAAYVYAQNTTDERPIAQTPPLEGRLTAGWSGGAWSTTGTLRWAVRQTRVDDDPLTGSGLDAGETPGWAALDLVASWHVGWGFRLVVGIDNALDRNYAEHLNRDDFFNPVRIQINEPGRAVWLRIGWSGSN